MYALEFPVEINDQQQIHLQLPKHICAKTARVIVMYHDATTLPHAPLTLGLFAGQIQMTDDFNDPLPDTFWLGETP